MNRIAKLTITMMLAVAIMIIVGCKKEETSSQPIGDTHEYVDLGLPSGTLWATCNVGANCPEDIGDYFAWGEIAPKDLYDWESYPYGSFNSETGSFRMIKYCPDDSLMVLELSDDAARACWGENWCMATKEEWEELYQKTTFEWTTVNGVEGRLMTGPNGNTMFLPATGFRQDGELLCPGLGIYWSNTRHLSFPERGWSLHFDWESCHVCGTYERNRGQVVRAVRINN